ncbi:MAG: hypothetical protein IJ301_04550 [Clostridia bacterium]|nr:hypothetical protein [Clostridia bacterium]
MKEKKRFKKGCIKNSLIILFIVIATGVIALFVILGALGGSAGDAKLNELLNREYSIPFADKITTMQEQETQLKLVQNFVLSDGSNILTNGEFDFDKFSSDLTRLQSDISLTGYDFAVLANCVLGSLASDDFVNIFKLIDFNLQTVESSNTTYINYRATLKIDLTSLKSQRALEKLPDFVYITFDTTLDTKMSLDNMLVGLNLQINRLTGDDNAYAVEKLMELLGLTQNDINSVAKFPVDYFVEQVKIWQANFSIENSMFLLTKIKKYA